MNDLQERGSHTSASNAQADFFCPGRHLAQAGLPDLERGDDAQFGTNIHRALAGDHKSLVELNLEEREVHDACDQIELALIQRYFGAAAAMESFKTLRERRLWIAVGTLEHSGQLDVAHIAMPKALVLEFKTLAGDIEHSPKNMQLRDQVILLDRNFPGLEEIACAVIQPFVTHKPELCVYQREDIKRATLELAARVEASNNPVSPRIPGVVQCKFCKAKLVCLPYQQWAAESLPVAKGLVDLPMADWSSLNCAQFLAKREIAQAWLDSAIEMIKTRLKAGEAIPGWCLKDGQNRQTVTDPQAVFDRFGVLGGNLQAFMGCIKVEKGKLREALHAATGAKGQALDRALEALLAGLTETKQTAPSIVREKGQ